jgi:hypothetical protein
VGQGVRLNDPRISLEERSGALPSPVGAATAPTSGFCPPACGIRVVTVRSSGVFVFLTLLRYAIDIHERCPHLCWANTDLPHSLGIKVPDRTI